MSFYPSGRTELKNPAGKATRAFTEITGFASTSIYLYASDWPHTFTGPVRLADVFYDGGEYYNVLWSKDGTVLAVTVLPEPGQRPSFTSAYDFQKHEVIRTHTDIRLHDADDHHKITALMESRGGIGESPNDLDDGKGDFRLTTPLWVWVAPVMIFGICFQLAEKMWSKKRKKKKTSVHSINPEAALQ